MQINIDQYPNCHWCPKFWKRLVQVQLSNNLKSNDIILKLNTASQISALIKVTDDRLTAIDQGYN